jgi:hypothetical protein
MKYCSTNSTNTYPSWIASYLTNRRQRVTVNGHSSEWKQVLAGVIQGSVLGPILFLLFIADINDYLPPGVDLLKYADDILAYIIGEYSANLPQLIVDGIQRWCADNKMRLNTSKCKIISFHTPSPPSITLNGHLLEYVTSYKYLGVLLNNKLDSNQQWERVYSSICSLPFLLKQLKLVGWSQKMLITAYKAYGISHFVYSAPILTSCNTNSKSEMSHFQRKILRIIGISQTAAASQFNLRPINELIDDICIRLLNRILIDSSHPLHTKLKFNQKTKSIEIPRFHHSKYQNSFFIKYLRYKRDGTHDLYLPR